MKTLQLPKTESSTLEEMETLKLSDSEFLTLEEILQSIKPTNPIEENSQIPYNLDNHGCQACRGTCRGGCTCMLT